MAMMALIVFGGTTALCAWTLWATVAPQYARIVDLLLNGPLVSAETVVAAPVRGTMRDVRVRRVVRSSSLRAAA